MNELDTSAEARETAQAQARGVLVKLTLCLKLATMHHLANQALKQPVAALVEAVNEQLAEANSVQVQAVGENVFLNKELIRLDASSFDSATTLHQMTKRLGVNEISFTAAIGESDVFELLTSFQRHYGSKDPKAFRAERFARVTVRTISAASVKAGGLSIDERQNVVRCYALLALTIQQTAERIKAGREPRMVAVRRAVQGLAEGSRGLESMLVGITRFPAMRGQPHFHLASVAALALLMARRIELPRAALVDVGLAAAFHDVARLDATTTEPAVSVAVRTALWLMRSALSTDVLSRATVALEAVLPVTARTPMAPSALARFIAVPCAFEQMTSGAAALPPDLALRTLARESGERYDGRAVKLLTTVVGLYPVGTTVRLSSGEVAMVVDAPADPRQLARPRVKVIRDASGAQCDISVELSSPTETRTIEGTLDAASVDISVPDLLLA